jgi:hypothetical protein
MENYNIYVNVTENEHFYFNKECENIDINNFRNNPYMKKIVQNCPYDSGMKQLNFINMNYRFIWEKLDLDLIKKYDSFGGNDSELINGLTPKVYSYIREAIIFCKFYLEPNNIKEINNLLIIGGGYGLEFCILYSVCKAFDVNIKIITGIDMPNVAKLQNKYFELVGMNYKFRSYSLKDYNNNPDYVYSNCCLAELPCKINYEYYNKFCIPSKGFYIVWGKWAAEIPEYYKPYLVSGKLVELINADFGQIVNAIIVK